MPTGLEPNPMEQVRVYRFINKNSGADVCILKPSIHLNPICGVQLFRTLPNPNTFASESGHNTHVCVTLFNPIFSKHMPIKLATFSMLYGMPKRIHEKAIDMCDPTIHPNIDFNHLLYYPETEKRFDASLLIVIISANLHVTPLCWTPGSYS